MNNNPTTLIFSAELASLDSTFNSIRTTRAMNMLNDLGIDYKAVMGVYKGDSETSFVVPVVSQSLKESLVKIMLDKFGQESVLELSPRRRAFLLTKDGEKCIGNWKEVTREYATSQDSYTYDQRSEKYWAVV